MVAMYTAKYTFNSHDAESWLNSRLRRQIVITMTNKQTN
jgi:hypothetical protein